MMCQNLLTPLGKSSPSEKWNGGEWGQRRGESGNGDSYAIWEKIVLKNKSKNENPPKLIRYKCLIKRRQLTFHISEISCELLTQPGFFSVLRSSCHSPGLKSLCVSLPFSISGLKKSLSFSCPNEFKVSPPYNRHYYPETHSRCHHCLSSTIVVYSNFLFFFFSSFFLW